MPIGFRGLPSSAYMAAGSVPLARFPAGIVPLHKSISRKCVRCSHSAAQRDEGPCIELHPYQE
jgi:hypothetical protein